MCDILNSLVLKYNEFHKQSISKCFLIQNGNNNKAISRRHEESAVKVTKYYVDQEPCHGRLTNYWVPFWTIMHISPQKKYAWLGWMIKIHSRHAKKPLSYISETSLWANAVTKTICEAAIFIPISVTELSQNSPLRPATLKSAQLLTVCGYFEA